MEPLMASDSAPVTAWDRVTLARHPQRPRALDFVSALCEGFIELHGDRQNSDDRALIGGVATFRGRSVMILGNQKGRNTRENLERNFGMARPEGYRKALRLMRHAEKFQLPLITFIDIPGADPGPTSEERGQAMAIADSIQALSDLNVPTIAIVIGEGGSGGALALGLADRVIMLENAVYTVASPEASASILWKDATQAPAAAAAMRITAPELLEFELIDAIVPEAVPAHEDSVAVISATGDVIESHLTTLLEIFSAGDGLQSLLNDRYAKYRAIGRWNETLPVQ
jgi:acetyl-CoA carboxylase carboxyl transferase subunit alpha